MFPGWLEMYTRGGPWMTPPSYFGSLRNTSGDANVKHRLTGPSGPLQGPQHVACSCSPRRFRDVQNLLCVVVRTLPNVIVLFCEPYRS